MPVNVERLAPNAQFVYLAKFFTATPTGLELPVPKDLTFRKFWFASGITSAGSFIDGSCDFSAGGMITLSLPHKHLFSAATGGPDITFGGEPIVANRMPASDCIYFTDPGQTQQFAACPLVLNVVADKIKFNINRFNGNLVILMACLSMSPL